MNKFALTLAAVLLGTAAFAAVTAESVAVDLAGQGYTDIQVSTNGSTIEATATRDGQSYSVVYDAATGDVVTTGVDTTGTTDDDSDDDASGSGASGGEASGGDASGGDSSGGGGSGGGSGSGQAFLKNGGFDYLNGGQQVDIEFG